MIRSCSRWIKDVDQGKLLEGGTAVQPEVTPEDTRQKFTSKERDGESGLDYFGARYSSFSSGRFTGVDPYNIILEMQGQTQAKRARAEFVGYLSDPRRWDRYSFALDNPLLYIDPDGLDIIIQGGTEDQRRAVQAAIANLRAESATANADFAKFDPTPKGDGPNLTITITEDSALEAQAPDPAQAKTVDGLTSKGEVAEDVNPTTNKVEKTTVSVNTDVRSSAVNLASDQRDFQRGNETKTEAILSHEVGHASDIEKDHVAFAANTEKDKGLPYRERTNEQSANATSHRIVSERMASRFVNTSGSRQEYRWPLN